MAAVDPSNSSGAFEASGNALNEKIMALANALAFNLNQEVHILNCWQHPMENHLRNVAKLSNDELNMILLEANEQQKRRLATFLNKINPGQIRYHVHLRRGKAEQLIPAVARENKIDFVIIGAVGRSGLDAFMFGNTAEKILCHSNLSLLAVKPSGYQPSAIADLTPSEVACEL